MHHSNRTPIKHSFLGLLCTGSTGPSAREGNSVRFVSPPLSRTTTPTIIAQCLVIARFCLLLSASRRVLCLATAHTSFPCRGCEPLSTGTARSLSSGALFAGGQTCTWRYIYDKGGDPVSFRDNQFQTCAHTLARIRVRASLSLSLIPLAGRD